jgi:glycine/D-amino acid oxidase-like deaminating enzyme
MTTPADSLPGRADVVIAGGGIIGTCVAFFLKELGFGGSVLVLERDMSFRTASTTLSAAGIRQQFTTPLNARMSQFGFAFLRSLPQRFGPEADVALRENGYLIVASAAGEAALRRAQAAVVAEGAAVAWLDPAGLAARFPWLNLAGLAGGTLGLAGEGWFDAHLLLAAVRRAARAAGVMFRQAEVTGVETAPHQVTAVRTAAGERVGCGTLVNAAGPRSGALARLWGAAMPLLFDVSGFWMRPEGDGFLCGIQPAPEQDGHPGDDFEPQHELFEAVLWPALAHRVPAMERLRLQRAWAGHYEVNLLDHNGVVGRDGVRPNIIYATGFSGHGVMHAPATGRAVAELVVHGAYRALDLAPLGFDRIARGEALLETAVY